MNTRICLILLFLGSFLPAQNYVELLNLGYRMAPGLKSKEQKDFQTDYQKIYAEINIPFVLDSSIAFVTGLDYSQDILDLNLINQPANFKGLEALNLYSIRPKFGFNVKHHEKLGGTYVLLPKVSSDLIEWKAEDFQLGGLALLKFTKHDRLSLKLGTYASSEAFGFFIVPILGFSYQTKNNKWFFDTSLPIRAIATRKISNKLDAGLRFRGIINSYNLNDPTLNDHYVHRVSQEVNLFAQLKLLKGDLLLRAEAGYFNAEYLIFEDSAKDIISLASIEINDQREALNAEFESGINAGLSLIYRVDVSKR